MPHRQMLEALYSAGVAAADPRRAVERSVLQLALTGRIAVLALGKAAVGMAAGATGALRSRDLEVVAALVVSHEPPDAPIAGMEYVTGDHPRPGDNSALAAEAISRFVASAHGSDHALVLLSGGATSLCAAPVDGVSVRAMRETFGLLLDSGAPITVMNAFRRRILRWAAGRLAVALQPARVHCLIVSDVIGNDLEAIGSGPCVPDPLRADDVLALRQQYGLQSLPHEIVNHLRRTADGVEAETPKPGNPAFRLTETAVLLDNAAARSGVRSDAERHGFVMTPPTSLLAGEAAESGRQIAAELLALAERGLALGIDRTQIAVWGGEPVVTIGAGGRGEGGRCQELALACAHSLHEAGDRARGISVLAAGTDGRDGPTDAAGAVIDHETWARIAATGRSPERDLADHDAYPALRVVNALFITGATGTNVNDLVIAAIGGPDRPLSSAP